MTRRNGLTLIEVVIAILVFSIGGLGLAASAAAITKQISSSTLRSRAANIARSRSETAAASECGGFASGNSVTMGVSSVWTVGSGPVFTIDQRLERSDARGIHRDRFLSAMQCE